MRDLLVAQERFLAVVDHADLAVALEEVKRFAVQQLEAEGLLVAAAGVEQLAVQDDLPGGVKPDAVIRLGHVRNQSILQHPVAVEGPQPAQRVVGLASPGWLV